MTEVDLVGDVVIRALIAGHTEPGAGTVHIRTLECRILVRGEAQGTDGEARHVQGRMVATELGQIEEPGQGVRDIGLGDGHGVGIASDGGVILDADIQLVLGAAAAIGDLHIQLERQLVFPSGISVIQRALEGHLIGPVPLATGIGRGQFDLDHSLVIGAAYGAGVADQRLATRTPAPLDLSTTGRQPGRPV
ncbi:hypothetical protein D3C78_943630 [compost metagenome]